MPKGKKGSGPAKEPSGRGRGRPRKSSPETAPLSPSHNDLTDEQKQGLFLNGLGKIEKLKAQMATINAAIRNERKTMKAEGYSKVEVDYALFLNKKKDAPEEIEEQRRARERVAKWMARPEGYQGGLFDGPGDGRDRTPAVDRAKEEGKVAGLNGESAKPPYDASTPQGQAWLHGHADGQAVRLKGFKTIDPQPEAERDLRPGFMRDKEKGMPSAKKGDDGAPVH